MYIYNWNGMEKNGKKTTFFVKYFLSLKLSSVT